MKKLYSTRVTASGDRQGRVESSDGVLKLDLSMPEGLGGPGGSGTNPEQLFAAGYSACFESALRLVARQKRKDVDGASVSADVDIGKLDDGNFALAVELTGRIPTMPREEAEELMHAAHQVCPYSRATRGNVDVKLSVEA